MDASMNYVLTITQQAKELGVSVFDEGGRLVSYVSREFDEPHPDELLSAVITLIDGALRHAGITSDDLTAIGMAASCFTIVGWDGISGQPLGSFQTPTLWSSFSAEQKATYVIEEVKRLASSMDMSLVNVRLGGLHTWFLWNLSQGRSYKIDDAHDLMAIDSDDDMETEMSWHSLCGLSSTMFPTSVAEPGELAHVSSVYLNGSRTIISALTSIPVAGLIGSGITASGKAFINYGQDGFVVMRIPQKPLSVHSELSIRKARLGMFYEDEWIALARFSFAQTLLVWMKTIQPTFAEVAQTPLGLMSDPSIIVTPFLDHGVEKAAIIGIDADTSFNAIHTAALRSMAYAASEALETMQHNFTKSLDMLCVERSGFAVPALFWFQAGISTTVVVERERDAYARGTAILTGIGAKLWTLSQGIKRFEEHVTSHRYDSPEGGSRMKLQRKRWQKTHLDFLHL